MDKKPSLVAERIQKAIQSSDGDAAVGVMGTVHPATTEEYFEVVTAAADLLTQWPVTVVMAMSGRCDASVADVWRAAVLRSVASQGRLGDVMDLLQMDVAWSRGAVGQALEAAAAGKHDMVVRALTPHSDPSDRRYLAWVLMRQKEPQTLMVEVLLDGIDVVPLAVMLADDDLWGHVDQTLPWMTDAQQKMVALRGELQGQPHATALKDSWALQRDISDGTARAEGVKKM